MKKRIAIAAIVIIGLAMGLAATLTVVSAQAPKPYTVLFGTDDQISSVLRDTATGQYLYITKSGAIAPVGCCSCPTSAATGAATTGGQTTLGPPPGPPPPGPPPPGPPPPGPPPGPPPPSGSSGNPGNDKNVGKAGECPNGNCGQFGWDNNGDRGSSNGNKGGGKK